MDRLLPTDTAQPSVADDTELERLYAYPDGLDRPWVSVNFISSADGAVSSDGRSAGLSDANDKRIFRLGRLLADVILVGSTTALVERYKGVRRSEVAVDRRTALGLAEVPPIAVVTRRCSIDPGSPLLTDTEVAPIVLTTESAPQARRTAVADAGADVVVVGDQDVDLPAALAALAERGLRRVCCEGGPRLFGSMIAADLVDQLCLSIAPLLVAGDAGRISAGPLPGQPIRMTLRSVLHAEGLLMLRYLRQ
ncbi:MAG TPA: pyrimidine reductase family protein [Pseudonocardiaceae bacterium]|jgi:5-amino-6-(5-phosphoribosylamino)uracil reductase|nr:pyrimidine reductase family protein [Pseudonocardiaceae bacterium]